MPERARLAGSLQPRDDRRCDSRDGIGYRPAWGFKGPTEEFLREQLLGAPGPVVHVCAGASRLGDVRCDMFHPAADVVADARALPFRGVGTVLADPPWGLPLPERLRFVRAAAVALRLEGLLLPYAPWMPQSAMLALEGAWVRHRAGLVGFPQAPVLLTRWRKVAPGPDPPPVEAAP